MAVQKLALTHSFPAAADLSSAQYKAVKLTANGVDLAGAGDYPIGVLQNAPSSGGTAEVGILGITKATVNAATTAIAKGDLLTTGASGVLVKAATTGDIVVAQALEAASADGVIISVIWGSFGGLSVA